MILQELINICCLYSIEIDLNFNATKSYCMIFTPRNYKRLIPPLYLNKLSVLYTDSIKYLGYTFSSNNCDDNDMLKQMRMLYCRSNRLVRLFSKCSLSYVKAFALYFTVRISGQTIKRLHFLRSELLITTYIARY